LICIHNLNWEDWYSLSKAWFHLFQSTPTFCEIHTNASCIGKLLILYNSTMFYSPLFKTSSSRSSLLISFHVPQLPLILSLLCGPYIVTGHINLTTQLHCTSVTPTRDMIKSILKELFSHYTWIYMSLDMTTKTSGFHSFRDVMQCTQEACNFTKTKSIVNSHVYQNSNHVHQWQPKYGKRVVVLLMCLYNMVTNYISVCTKKWIVMIKLPNNILVQRQQHAHATQSNCLATWHKPSHCTSVGNTR
jgi:hypothetical protein